MQSAGSAVMKGTWTRPSPNLMSCKLRNVLGVWKRGRQIGVNNEFEIEFSPHCIDRRLGPDPEHYPHIQHDASDEDTGSQKADGFGGSDVFGPQFGLIGIGEGNGRKIVMFVRGGHILQFNSGNEISARRYSRRVWFSSRGLWASPGTAVPGL